MTQISLNGLSKSFGKNTVIPGLDLDVQGGEFLVLLGPSGCGKSTLLRLIAGLETASGGDIMIGGARANQLEPRERGCAMVFQNYALYPHMNVRQNIGYALKVAGVPRAEREARVAEVAKSVGLGELLERKPAELSGGQRQRVAMGRAMIRNPKIFLYDEPLSNLDARLRVAMRIEIRKLHQKLGTTTLFVTHDQVEAMTLADRIVVMNKGVIEQVGTPAEIYSNPASTYVASFVGTPGMNLLNGDFDAGAATIRLKDGQVIALPKDASPPLPSGPLVCGIRAEDLATGGAKGLNATLQFTEELGASRLVHTLLAGETVIAQHAGTQPPAAGAAITLQADVRKLHLFDAVSGRNLGHPGGNA
ncbi:MAG: sn-glycerol-3-phosphate ABC transporter ATP-binding protein UgpC [Alphaproteobacteria bacterium]|nr:sn-glycerol-3-phosphate ABC transporter ATP-binding protein UgpC [Alphaproteobacteria bacterium]